MLYYDLSFNDPLIINLENYRKFLRRNKLVTNTRKERLNKFLNLLEKLIYLREGDPHLSTSSLHSDTLSITNIEYRDWLLNKIKEIENINSCKQKVYTT